MATASTLEYYTYVGVGILVTGGVVYVLYKVSQFNIGDAAEDIEDSGIDFSGAVDSVKNSASEVKSAIVNFSPSNTASSFQKLIAQPAGGVWVDSLNDIKKAQNTAPASSSAIDGLKQAGNTLDVTVKNAAKLTLNALFHKF